MKVVKKELSGSESGKEIVLGSDPVLIHKTPNGLNYSEIWLFALNRTDKPTSIDFIINGERISVGYVSKENSPQDLYGGTGAITYPGDEFLAKAEEPNRVSILGWVYEVKT